jgi:hypothetical protein
MFAKFACFFALALPLVACAASTESSSTADTTGQDLSAKTMLSCNVDSDCVAIEKPACCPNGMKVAVNKSHVTAYRNANKCEDPPTVCPMFLIDDTRVAQCNTESKQCEMILPGDISCGGFVANPHTCPDGMSCMAASKMLDAPGKCVEDTTPAQSCGGLAGLPCPDGYTCQVPTDVKDGLGTCVQN